MPETMAAMRLSSLEISDCIDEFAALGYHNSLSTSADNLYGRTDLASGLRSSANLVSAAEKGVHQGTRVIKDAILPAIRDKAPDAKSVLICDLKWAM